MIVVGLGTGRCGTHSLARLLASQDGADVTHEMKPPLRWCDEPNPTKHLAGRATLSGDVGFYYLPHVERIWAEMPEAVFVCLKRPRDETVASWVRYMPDGRNWLQNKGERTAWDASFPTYDSALTFEQSAGRYWDDYYARADDLMCDRFRLFPMDSLNDEYGVRRILAFCGVDNPLLRVGLKLEATA